MRLECSEARGGSQRRIHALIVTIATAIALLGQVPPAQASSFPGANGLIVFAGNQVIHTINSSGGSDIARTPPRALTDPNGDFEPSWSWYADRIAFSSSRLDAAALGNRDIFTMKKDGSDLRRLTTYSGLDAEPTWAPDSSKIAFVSDRSLDRDIFVMDATGAGQVNITKSAGDDAYPSWSPLADRIAFSSIREGRDTFGLFTMAPDGIDVELIDGDGNNIQPNWSPDGSKIAFVSDRDGTRGIYTIEPGTSGSLTQLTGSDLADDSHPSFSPDGTQIAFSRGGDLGEIWVMNADGSNQHPILQVLGQSIWPDWGQNCSATAVSANEFVSVQARVDVPGDKATSEPPHDQIEDIERGLDELREPVRSALYETGADPTLIDAPLHVGSPCAAPPSLPALKKGYSPPQPDASDAPEPIIYVHGNSWPDQFVDCRGWNPVRNYLKGAGWTGPHLYVHYYHEDQNCDYKIHDKYGQQVGATLDTPIEEIAAGLAWQIYRDFTMAGRNVRIVAHSMGGVVARYAVAASQLGSPLNGSALFPPGPLLVSDVVTLGTPHTGASALSILMCLNTGYPKQCRQLDPLNVGETFLADIASYGQDPQGVLPTDWSLIGSYWDKVITCGEVITGSPDSCVGMDANHKYLFKGADCDKVKWTSVLVPGTGTTYTLDLIFFTLTIKIPPLYVAVPNYFPCVLAFPTHVQHTTTESQITGQPNYRNDLDPDFDSVVRISHAGFNSGAWYWSHAHIHTIQLIHEALLSDLQ